ncbi:MAG: hypothetical protein IIA01_07230 [Proteobacteria bacterium]|nr:hypothetical protein [Pseudomonadota bacterium]
MTIYGLLGVTHGWGRLVTVMSAHGAAAVRAHIDAGGDVAVVAGEGGLTQYHARRAGALDRLIERYGIIVLSNDAWDAKKAELGAAIRR